MTRPHGPTPQAWAQGHREPKRPSVTKLQHIMFLNGLGDRLLDQEGDGGGTDRDRRKRRAKARAARKARKANRR